MNTRPQWRQQASTINRRRRGAAVLVAALFAALVGFAPSASAADPINYTFRFVNGTTISGVADNNTVFLPNAGGSSASSPSGMEVHVSCSDEFPGGWGEKDGPVQGVDTAWQIDSYYIQKGSKTCGTPTPPPPPPEPAIDIEMFVNGDDADTPTGPTVATGSKVTYTYVVTNTGDIALDIDVIDTDLGDVPCDDGTKLQPGASRECSSNQVTAAAGQQTDKATVVGKATIPGPTGPPAIPAGAGDDDYVYQFRFVNGTVIEGYSSDKTGFIANAGGSSVNNPTGMEVHLSCSDDFPGGWGEKDGPVQGVDTAWQIEGYYIAKLKDGQIDKFCGTPGPTAPTEVEVMDMDPINYIGERSGTISIDIEKFVNGQDADTPTGPKLPVGSIATFTYEVTNTGELPLFNVKVIDNVAGAITCPKDRLQVGESMSCSPTTMVVEEGQQFMEAETRGWNGPNRATDDDPVYYFGEKPTGTISIDVEKFVNGQDADTPTGPKLPVGSTATFTYVVTNTGSSPLFAIRLFDNVAGELTCPSRTLQPGAVMDCEVTTMVVEEGQQFMEAEVRGWNGPNRVTDSDPVYYFGETTVTGPDIEVKVLVNNRRTPTAGDAVTVPTGSYLPLRITVINRGNTTVTGITATTAGIGTLTCEATTLAAGERTFCFNTRIVAQSGLNALATTASGSTGSNRATVTDTGYYFGQ